jgi:hypothetical protein
MTAKKSAAPVNEAAEEVTGEAVKPTTLADLKKDLDADNGADDGSVEPNYVKLKAGDLVVTVHESVVQALLDSGYKKV